MDLSENYKKNRTYQSPIFEYLALDLYRLNAF